MNKNLTNLLEDCTVRIEVGDSFGTGFFVASGMVITCAHVVKPDSIKNTIVKAIYKKKEYKVKISKKNAFSEEYPDLALFKVNIPDHPCVYLDDDIQVWDKFYSYGYTADQIKGEGVTIECEGHYDEDHRLIKLKKGQIQYGFSGSPLLNARTEHVSGILQMSRSPDGERGGFAFPMESVNKFFPGLLEKNRKFHDGNSQWEDACEQPIKRSITNVPVIYNKPGTVVEPGKQLFGHSRLLDQVLGFLREGKRVLLTGMTGIGKTFLAENLTENWLQVESKRVAWLKVGYQDQEALQDSLMEILAKMGAERSQYDRARGDNKRLVLLSLFEESGVDLLVFDDARNMDAMAVTLRAIPEGVPVLITSRQFLDLDEIIDVDEEQLQFSDALALLEYYAGGKNYAENPDAKQLCKDFDCHPLALELCGSIMRRQRRSPQELLKKLTLDPLNLSRPGHVGLRALLDDSFEDLGKQSQLVFTGFGAFYENGTTSAYLGEYLGMPVEVFGKALDDLFNYNLIDRRQGMEFYFMHDLVFAYSQTLVKVDGHVSGNLIDSTLKYLERYRENYEVLSLDMPNLISVADRSNPTKLVEIISWLTIGGYPTPGPDSYFENKGHSQVFLNRLDQAIANCRKNSRGRKSSLHFLIGKRGNAFFNIADYKNAIAYYEEAMELAPNQNRKAILMSVMARTYAIAGNSKKAREYFQASYKLADKLQNELLLASIMGQESHAASVTGDYNKIQEIASKQIVIARKLIDRTPSPLAYKQLLVSLLNLGTAKMDLSKQGIGSFRDAVPILQEVHTIAINQRSDIFLAHALNTLGECYHYLNKRKDAKKCFEESLLLWRELGVSKYAKELEELMKALEYSVPKGPTIV